jgi:hypothetical protein
MGSCDSKVIGYFAHGSPTEVVCTPEAACLITGTEAAMRAYLGEITGDQRKHSVRKTRFGDILRGLKLGAAYAFDEEAWGRFEPLGRASGLALPAADFAAARQRGDRFITIALDVREARL